MLETKDILTPELKQVENKIRQGAKAPNNDFSNLNVEGVSYENDYFYNAPMQSLNNKKTFETRDYNILDAYAPLSDGTYVARYDTYKAGIDNYEQNAQTQSTGEKWSNGLQKFAGKTFNSVLGGTAGVVYGIGSGISDGSWSAVYDNEFSNWLNDLDTKMNNQLANYYTKQEQDYGLFGQMSTANFWSDKVLGGLSFTAGAIVSEGIWAAATGGASLVANPFRWAVRGVGASAVAKGVSGTKSILKSVLRPTVGKANIVGRFQDGLNLARFTATSAGYEASVEALQFRKEQEANFYSNFKELNGRMPSKEEEEEFKLNLESASNSVFATNMAIVGSSNLVTMGNIFKIKSPIKTDLFGDVRKSVYGIGKEAGELSRLNKINRVTLPLVQNMVVEGLYEEGSQSITSNVAGQWLSNTYDESVVEDSFNLSGALYDSFAEQYGTKEGWVENGVGMIIGLLGEGVSGNTRNELNKEIRDYTSRQKLQETYTPKVVSEAFLNANRVSKFNKQAEDAQAKGNLTEARIAQDGTIVSMLTNRHQLGDSMDEVRLDVEAGLNTVTQEQLKEIGISEDVKVWRENQLEAFTNISDSFSRNREFAERVIGRGTALGLSELDDNNKLNPAGAKNNQEALIQSLTFSLIAGQRAHSVMEEAVTEVSGILGEEKSKVIDVVNKLSTLSDATKRKVANAKVKINALRQRAVQLQKELERVTNMPESEEGNVEKGNKILSISNQIADTQARLGVEEASAIELTQSINTANNSLNKTKGLLFNQVKNFSDISLEDILKLDENVKKLDDSLNDMREVSPETTSRVEAILAEHKNAREAFKNYQASVKMFQDGTFNIKNVNTKLGKILNKNVKLDDANREWLSGILSDYTDRVVSNLSQEAKLQIQQEVEITTDSILDKRRGNSNLTPAEEVFYQENKAEIDTRLKQEPLPPIVESEVAPLTDAEYLKQRLESVLSRLDNATIPVDNLQEPPPKPTIQDVQEYKELFARQSFEYLTAGETVRLNELEAILSAWKVLDSYLDSESGMTLADMTELLAQVEQEVEEAETVARLDSEDILASTSDADAHESKTDYSLGQNVLASATVKRNTDGTLTLHHIEPLNILSNNFTVERKGEVLQNPKGEIQPLDKVLDSTGLEFVMDGRRNIVITKNEFDKLGFIIINSGTVNWSYSDIYEFNGSDFIKRKSDYVESGLEPEHLASVEKGRAVRFEIDRNDSHTQKLLSNYNSNPSEENRKALQDGVKIFIMIDGKRVSDLKGQRDLILPIFSDIRAEAFKVITEEIAINDLGITTTVKGVFLGSPQLFIDQNGRVETREFTDSSVGKVLATGYIQDGEITLSNEIAGEVNKTYVGKVSNKRKGKKLPLVVVKRGINFVALPIQLNSYTMTEQEVDEIMSTVYSATSQAEASKAINDVIQNNNLGKISKILPNQVSDQKVEEVRNALLALENTITAEQLASEKYKKESLKTDAQMYIDIDNLPQVIKDFKVRIDLENIRFNQDLDFDINDSKTSIENELNDLALELQSDLLKNSTTKYVDSKGNDYEHKYIEVFDETPIEKSSVNTIKQKNIKTLREAFSHNPQSSKILRSAITQERLDRVKNLFKALDKINEQTRVNSQNKKSGKDNTNCK